MCDSRRRCTCSRTAARTELDRAQPPKEDANHERAHDHGCMAQCGLHNFRVRACSVLKTSRTEQSQTNNAYAQG